MSKVNGKGIRETCVEHECKNCGCRLLVFKNDIKRVVAHKKGDVFDSWDWITITEFDDIELKQQIDVDMEFTEEVWESRFVCIACSHKQVMSSNQVKARYDTPKETSRKHNHYYLSTDADDLKITDEQFEEMKDWNGKKLIKYFNKHFKEEEE